MSLADLALSEGRLDDAFAEVQKQVRSQPADAKLRTFLFQLMCVQGQWERALNQLGVVSELTAAALPMSQAYREAIRCELLREEIFAGKRSPLIFGEPEPWIAFLMESLRVAGAGNFTQAAELRDRAFDEAPAIAGALLQHSGGEQVETPFEWIADADSRLGPIFEMLVNGRYFWVPANRVKQIDLEKPADLRDMVWMPAHVTWANGGDTVAFIPTRYPGSAKSAEPRHRLSRQTDWSEPADGLYFGIGQRMLTTDAGDHPLLDIRQIRLDLAAEEPTEMPSAELAAS